MIKAIVFDNNGVLTSCDADCTIPRFAKYFGADEKKFGEIFNTLVAPADLGYISTDDFFKNLAQAAGKGYRREELWAIFFECYNPKDGARAMLCDLKRNFQIALLTNFVDAFDEINQKVWHYDDIFGENIFVSSKLGMSKPNDDIFSYTLTKLGLEPDEVVFVDDRPVNVNAAQRLGMKGILFENVKKLENDLSEMIKY